MTTIARGKASISQNDLKKLFNLPEEVSIIDVRMDDYGAFNFGLASKEPIERLTHVVTEEYGMNNFRRRRVPLDEVSV